MSICRSTVALALTLAGLATGCMTTGESAEKQRLTEDVGRYSAPPPGIDKPRTGVPMFELTGQGSSRQLAEIAADQLTSLAGSSERFNLIERAQLNQNLKEQGLEGIVAPEELAQSGKVRGCEFLLLGKVTNLRVKAETARRGFGLGNLRLPGAGSLGAFDFKRKDSTITAECGVDIRLVNATTGEVATTHHSDFKRTDTIGAFGVEVLGANADADADLQLDEDNKGALLRLALDDAFRGMLPKIDKFLLARGKEKAAAATPPAPPPVQPVSAAPTTPAAPPAEASTEPAAAKKFCSGCGAQLAAGAKFCGGCGAKLE